MTVIRVSAGALALLMAAILLLPTLATPAAAAGEERIGPHGTALADTAASAPFQVAQNAEPAGEPTRTELLLWDSVKDSRYPEEFKAYLDRYPEGTFAALARSRLKRLGGTVETPAAQASATSGDAPPDASSTPSANAQGDEVYKPYKKMWAAKRADVRFGPSTGHPKVDLLEAGKKVRVVAKTGDWYKLEAQPGQGMRYVHASLLTESKPARSKAAAATEPPKKSAASPSATAQADEVYKPYKKMWAAKRADVRAGPSASRETIDQLRADKSVYVASRTGDWYKLWPRPGQENRYVYAPLLTDVEPGTVTARTSPAQTRADEVYKPYKKMQAAKRANVRAGPSTSREKIDQLEVGKTVYVASRTGDWYKLWPRPGQEDRYVYAPLLTDRKPASTRTVASRSTVKTINYSSGGRYRGEVRNGKLHGHGVYSWPSGNRYEGDWVNGERTGRGVLTWKFSGDRYEGDFVNGDYHGKGTFTYSDGTRIIGRFKRGEPHEHATPQQRRNAKSCIDRRGNNTYRNTCREDLSFFYCFTETDGHGSTCGRPSVKRLWGEPEYYYTHLEYLSPGETFKVPFGDKLRFRWVACPHKTDGTAYHAFGWRNNTYTCRTHWREVAETKLEEAAKTVRRAEGLSRDRERELARQREREQERRQAERQRRQAELDREWEEERGRTAWDKFNDDLTRWSTEALERAVRNSGSSSLGPKCRDPELKCVNDDAECLARSSLPLCSY